VPREHNRNVDQKKQRSLPEKKQKNKKTQKRIRQGENKKGNLCPASKREKKSETPGRLSAIRGGKKGPAGKVIKKIWQEKRMKKGECCINGGNGGKIGPMKEWRGGENKKGYANHAPGRLL